MAAARAMPKAFWPRRWRRPSGCAPTARRASAWCSSAGEERGSDGAKAANRIASKSRFLINGEPTDLRLGAATRGAFRVRLTATGKAAHSGYPELGESAIEKLIDCLMALRTAAWPADPLLGTTHYTVGLISGGVAPNVIPPNAEAEVFFRTVGDHARCARCCAKTLAGRVEVRRFSNCRRFACTPCPASRPRCFRISATSRS